MARNRVIYQSKAVYAGPDKGTDNAYGNESGATQPTQLKRVQSANYGFDIARTDVNQFGELAAIDRIILESPTVNFDSSWYACNWYNEDVIGLTVTSGIAHTSANFSGVLSDILTNGADERNYYVRVGKDGDDMKDVATGTTAATGDNAVIGIGNAFLSNWTCEAAVGGFPTASMTAEALNIKFDRNNDGAATGKIPAIDAAAGTAKTEVYRLSGYNSSGESADGTSVVKPGDVTLTLPSTQGGANYTNMHIQSFNCSVDLAREPINKLGSRFAFARVISFPITTTLSVDAIMSEMSAGNLVSIIDSNADQEIIVSMNNGAGAAHMAIVMKKAKLDSQSFSQGIGDNETVTLNWSAQIGSSGATDVGLFLSGNSQ